MNPAKRLLSPPPPFQSSVLYLKNLYKLANFLCIFPNEFISAEERLQTPSQLLRFPSGKLHSFRRVICVFGFTILELLHLVPFLMYIMKPQPESQIVLQSLCWEYLSGTSYASFFMWNLFSGPEMIINCLNQWHELEEEILGIFSFQQYILLSVIIQGNVIFSVFM